MWRRLLTWLDMIAITDPLRYQQARLLIRLFLVLFFAGLASMPIVFSSVMNDYAFMLIVLALSVGLLGYPIAIWQIRRGFFVRGMLVGISGLMLLTMLFALPIGVLTNPTIGLSMMIPVVMGGLFIGRRTMLILFVLAIGLQAGLALLEGSGRITITNDPDIVSTIFGICVLSGIISASIAMFGDTLRTALLDAQARSTELEQLRAGLEQTVRDRTASLELAMTETQHREQRLTSTLAELQQSRATIRDLNAPVLPVLPHVLVAPLIGALDEQRIATFADHLLREVERQHARHVILDITGVPMVDTHVAQTLLRTAASVQLLGGQALLVGVRPEVAQTLVSLGVDLSGLPTHANLREAVASLV